jgi:Ca-activated chloride channel family protein
VRLRGKVAGREFAKEIRVSLPATQPANAVLPTLWARRRVDDLMSQDFRGLQRGTTRDDLKQQITKLGLDFRLMTPFTSFVAVEEKVVTEGGQPHRVEVPVEMPEGMSYDGVFGREMGLAFASASPYDVHRSVLGVVGGVAGGAPGGAAGQLKRSAPTPAPLPVPAGEPSAAAVKVDPRIAAVVQRVKSGLRPGIDEARFVFGGRALVRITLSDARPAAMEQLKKAGLTITGQQGNVVSGSVAVEKLEAVTLLPIVAQIVPGR